jgi:hypothetical protein
VAVAQVADLAICPNAITRRAPQPQFTSRKWSRMVLTSDARARARS